MRPRQVIEAFDRFLAERRLRFEAGVVGGVALSLMGIIERETKDYDVVQPAVPEDVAKAAEAFAAEQRGRGHVLRDDWLNNGPMSLADDLPPGWEERLLPLFSGTAIELKSLGRSDQLKAKLWALCDRGIDLPDCVALAPTAEELNDVLPWLRAQDTSPGWGEHVGAVLVDQGSRLDHGA